MRARIPAFFQKPTLFMKNLFLFLLCAGTLFSSAARIQTPQPAPSAERIANQKQFAADRFGIFLHWGIYSTFGQGEWYLNYGPRADEYAKAAAGFYPANFDAGRWADAIKDSGARYVCFTSRHHDGFSMWDTDQSDYNIVDATPFGRDVMRELNDSLASRRLPLHVYYSHIDWSRPDYPRGRTGKRTGVDLSNPDWDGYYRFMNAQLEEILTRYGNIRCIWFDGWWDHDEDAEPFDWHLDDQYAWLHNLRPDLLIANNHHQAPFPGEDIQVFERDIPGQNEAGLSGQEISRLPLETCQTMNGMWGYKLIDTNYKDTPTLIRYLVRTAGMGANLLLNIGPQPDGSLPATALERLHDIGQWLAANGETIYGTQGSPFAQRAWGTATQKGERLFLHIIDPTAVEPGGWLTLPAETGEVKSACGFADRKPLKLNVSEGKTSVRLPRTLDSVDHIIELTLK